MPENKYLAVGAAAVLATASTLWVVSQFVQDKVGLIEANASEITKNTVGDYEHKLRLSQRTRRDLRRELNTHPNDTDLKEDLDEIEDEIHYYEKKIRCLQDGNKSC